MKKIIFIFVIFILFSFYIYTNTSKDDNDLGKVTVFKEERTELKSVFISYIDYALLKGKSCDEQKNIIDQMVNNVSSFGLNNIILQVRPFADAIYNSNYFLSSSKVVRKEGDKLELDILEYFINRAHDENITLYAWLNPYRIRNSNNIDDIGNDSYFRDWFATDKIINNDEGIFFNPASKEVLELILNGVSEIVFNYNVDGVIYDDYFYPKGVSGVSDDEKINIIVNLIKETNVKIKTIDKDVLFGISPSGNIESNLKEEFLDINYVVKNNHVDFVIPQIYYGFLNQYKPYLSTLDEWSNVLVNTDLLVGLSLYKSGYVDKYAGSGSDEWVLNDDIIKKQIVVARGYSNYKGFAIYRYNNLFVDSNDFLDKEIINIKSIIN